MVLMGCDGLTFTTAHPMSQKAQLWASGTGRAWHQYGDARWGGESTWVEFSLHPFKEGCEAGVLVLRKAIAVDGAADIADWVAFNHPFRQVCPDMRSEGAVIAHKEMVRQAYAAAEETEGPEDSIPAFVQCYCIFKNTAAPQMISRYTDLLNADGIVIPRFRIGMFAPDSVPCSRQALHTLFCLNELRLGAMDFLSFGQAGEFGPATLSEGAEPAEWTRFHPVRTLKLRPAVRALRISDKGENGILSFESFQKILETRRHEINAEMLIFSRLSRPRQMPFTDSNATVAAFNHRKNGGAIYTLPDALVAEFFHTDCAEIRLKDLKLPFPNLYLSFRPPAPLFLGDGAIVDGCYVVQQGEEFLFVLTSRWEDVDYSRSLSLTCLDPQFSLHLPMPADQPDITVEQAVEKGIDQFLNENRPPEDDISQTVTHEDGTTTHVDDIRASSRARRVEEFFNQEEAFMDALNIMANALCFITARPEDISEEWDREPPKWVADALSDEATNRSARDRRREALAEVNRSDFTRIRVCGRKLFGEGVSEEQARAGSGMTPRAHWRRGHWRRQRHGKELALVTLRWIRPTLVMKDNGSVVDSRIYEVENGDAGSTSSGGTMSP